jgi:hypothetical protein
MNFDSTLAQTVGAAVRGGDAAVRCRYNPGEGIQIRGICYEVALECVDDQSRGERVAEIYRELLLRLKSTSR